MGGGGRRGGMEGERGACSFNMENSDIKDQDRKTTQTIICFPGWLTAFCGAARNIFMLS